MKLFVAVDAVRFTGLSSVQRLGNTMAARLERRREPTTLYCLDGELLSTLTNPHLMVSKYPTFVSSPSLFPGQTPMCLYLRFHRRISTRAASAESSVVQM